MEDIKRQKLLKECYLDKLLDALEDEFTKGYTVVPGTIQRIDGIDDTYFIAVVE